MKFPPSGFWSFMINPTQVINWEVRAMRVHTWIILLLPTLYKSTLEAMPRIIAITRNKIGIRCSRSGIIYPIINTPYTPITWIPQSCWPIFTQVAMKYRWAFLWRGRYGCSSWSSWFLWLSFERCFLSSISLSFSGLDYFTFINPKSSFFS